MKKDLSHPSLTSPLISLPLSPGLEATEWPGRTQTLRHGPVTYYLDGAHTTGSMQACVHWFSQEIQQEESSNRLVFAWPLGGPQTGALVGHMIVENCRPI